MSPQRWIGTSLLIMWLGATLGGCAEGADETTVTGGAPCGPAICAADQYCCFAECGLCAPEGVACPQNGCN